MIDLDYVWRWELTPLEAYKNFTIWIPPPKLVAVEAAPFRKAPAGSLEGELEIQFGVSDKSLTGEIQDIRRAQPNLPLTGDRRSGVILLKNNKPIASYVIDGSRYKEQHRIAVNPEHRRQGLSTKMVLEWYKRTKRARFLTPQKFNPVSTRAFLSAQRAVYAWAVQTDKTIPDKVLREIASGQETSRIFEILDRVVKTQQAAIIE